MGVVSHRGGAARAVLEDWARRGLARLRGEISVARLVAQGLELGEGAFVGRHVYIDPGRPWLVSIGERAVVAPFVIIMAHDAGLIHHTDHARLGRVEIGARAFVGAGSILLPGTRIGADAVIGAGSVVRGEIPPRRLALGNPATVVGDVDEIAARHRRAAAEGPTWPFEGWSVETGITAERRALQRDALSDGRLGYVARRVTRSSARRDG